MISVLSSKQRKIVAALFIVFAAILSQFFPEIVPSDKVYDPHQPVWFEATTTVPLVQTRGVTSTVTGALTTSTAVIEINAFVVRVVDGDTIDVRFDGVSTTQKIRLLGVNTPETVDPRRVVQCFGKQASSFMKALLTEKHIRLDADPEADERDKYDRLLRNIVLPDGTDVNASLVGSGYAYAYVSFPQNKQRKKQLTRLQEEAKTAKRGLWAEGTCAGEK